MYFSKEIESFLNRLFHEDPASRKRLIDSEIVAGGFLEEGLNAFLEKTFGDFCPSEALMEPLVRAAVAFRQAREEIGAQIGPYQIIRKLGEGGMGKVYLAYQEHPFQRYVALKLMHEDLGLEAQARFRFEYQVLARLDHRAVARVFDAGSEILGDRRVPFFTMAYFPGIPITEFCRHHMMNLEERIHLFLVVCDGVIHAHQRGLIHRDLKPNNILARYVEDCPQVRIIDFGIAALLPNRNIFDGEPKEDLEKPIGTLLYMSPEQLLGGMGQTPDTRTDVYALGLLLFEMMTGSHPFLSKDFERMSVAQKRDYLLNEPLPNPAKRVGDKRTRRILSGDLGRVLAKAAAKQAKDRYGSVSAFGGDLRAFLEHRPLSVGPQKVTYRLGKLARRRRWALVSLFLVTAVILGSLIFSLGAWREAVGAERESRIARQDAERTTTQYRVMHEFLHNMLTSPNPYVESREVRVVDLLDGAGRRLSIDFSGQPELQASLHVDLAESNLGLGRYPMALFHFDEALRLRKEILGMNRAETLQVLERKAFVLLSQKETTAAEKLYRETMALQTQLLGPEHSDLYPTRRGLANTLARQGNYDEARGILETLEKEQLQNRGPDNPETLLTMRATANLWSRQNRLSAAAERYQVIADAFTRLVGPYHPYTLSTVRSYATTLSLQGQWEEEEKARRALLANLVVVLGEENPETILEQHLLARCLYQRGDYENAEPLVAEAFARAEEVMGSDQADTLRILNDLALIKGRLGKWDEKGRYLNEYLDRCRSKFGLKHRLTLHGMINLADHYRQHDRLEQAEALLRNVIVNLKDLPGSDYLMVFAIFNLAETLHAGKNYQQAVKAYRESLGQMEQVFDAKDPNRLFFQIRYGSCLTNMSRFTEAEEVLLKTHDEMTGENPHGQTILAALVALYKAWHRESETKRWQKRLFEWESHHADQRPQSTNPAQ